MDNTQDMEERTDVEAPEKESKFKRFKEKLRALPDAAASVWRKSARGRVKEGAEGAALALSGYLLGAAALPFGVCPLGIALLCASPKMVLWIFLGVMASALSLDEMTFIHLFAYITALAVRLLSRLLSDESDAVFGENIYLRMTTASVAAFMVGLYSVIVGEFQVYDLFGTLLAVLLAPAAAFVFSGAFDGENKRFRDLGFTALLTALTYSLRDMRLVGISLGVAFAFFATLYVCRRRGVWQGAVIGLLCGLAYSPVFAPVFVMAGIAAGALWGISPFGALVAAGASGMLWGFYIEGLSSMSRLLPGMIFASACYLWAQKLSFFPAARDLLFSGRYCADMNRALIQKESREKLEDKLSSLSDAFSSLSDIFYNLSDRLARPGIAELTRMCDGVYDKYCPTCQNRDVCWGVEYGESRELLALLSERLHTSGAGAVGDLPEYMRRRCVALPSIIGQINEETARLFTRARSLEKTEIFAMDYAAVSSILRDARAENEEENELDAELCEKVAALLSEYGFGEGGVSVYGKRLRRIVARGFDISGAGIGMKDLKEKVESTCGFAVSEPILELKEGFLTLKMSSARTFSAYGVSEVSNVGGEECGDTVALFENCEDRYYALISDGMGKGREAAFTSGVSSMFLRKMLGAGNRVPAVIKMLNSFVRSKPDECSAALDLMEFDLLNGHVEFYKCGAAPTYVRRGENLFKLHAETVPLGILRATDTAKLSFDAEDGDVVIMMSDGVRDTLDLVKLLTSEWTDDLGVMKRRIVESARADGSADDISVVLIKLSA